MPDYFTLLRDRVTLKYCSIDRIFLQAYVPKLQTVGQVCTFLRWQRRFPIPSSVAFGKIGDAYVEAIYAYAKAHNIPVVRFEKGEDKEKTARPFLVPGHEELAMGAIASGGVRVLNSKVLNRLSDAEKALREATAKEGKELKRRERQYREGREFRSIEGKTVILVDDGFATGATMRAAAIAIRQLAASRCVLAVPVGAPDTCAALRDEADEVISASTPNPFYAVGQFYRDFSQTTDNEVRELMIQAEPTP